MASIRDFFEAGKDATPAELAQKQKRRWAAGIGFGGLFLLAFANWYSGANSGSTEPSLYYGVEQEVHNFEREVLGMDVQPGFMSQCENAVGNLPVFQDYDQLANSKWAPYFRRVYGKLPTTRYPICVGSFNFLHKDALEEFHLEGDEVKVNNCWGQPGDVYQFQVLYQPAWATWIWHAPPFGVNGEGLPGDTWVEVSHLAQARESIGSWYYWSSGSGIWLNTGKTIVFHEHSNAWKRFCGGCKYNGGNRMMTVGAKNEGYDTMQFIWRADPTWLCNKGSPRGTMNIEIVSTKIDGAGTCGADPSKFRAGWDADQPCECDNGQPWLNCKGFGSEAHGRRPMKR